jgi:hypothetical protein
MKVYGLFTHTEPEESSEPDQLKRRLANHNLNESLV